MKNVALLILLSILSISGFSQLISDLPSLYLVDSTKQIPAESVFIPSRNGIQHTTNNSPFKPALLKNAHVGFELGTAFSSFGSGKNMLSTYVAPNITFQPTSKLQMYIGAYLGHNNAYGFNNNDVIVEATPVAAYSGANYFLTDRVNLFGNSLYGRGSYAAYPYGVNNDFKSISVGVSYRVSPRTTISAQFQWSSGLPPYGTNYWNGPLQGFTTPFDNPALGTATGSPIK
jgi:hypothetical protein